MDDSPSLDFDRWAAVAARMLGLDLEARAAILERLEIEWPAWEEAEEHWSRALAADIAKSVFVRAQRYAAWCSRELTARNAAPVACDASQQPGREICADTTVDAAPLLGDPLPFVRSTTEEALARIAAMDSHGPPSDRPADTDPTLVPSRPLESVTLPFAAALRDATCTH